MSASTWEDWEALLTGILSSHLLRVLDNLIPDLVEIVELLTGKMQELSPLVGIVLVQRGLGKGFLCEEVSYTTTGPRMAHLVVRKQLRWALTLQVC